MSAILPCTVSLAWQFELFALCARCTWHVCEYATWYSTWLCSIAYSHAHTQYRMYSWTSVATNCLTQNILYHETFVKSLHSLLMYIHITLIPLYSPFLALLPIPYPTPHSLPYSPFPALLPISCPTPHSLPYSPFPALLPIPCLILPIPSPTP